jgi:carbon storage regulator
MLVLSRKQDQTLVIDGQIQIRILRSSSGVVKLGIQAPQQIQVLRGELLRGESMNGERLREVTADDERPR